MTSRFCHLHHLLLLSPTSRSAANASCRVCTSILLAHSRVVTSRIAGFLTSCQLLVRRCFIIWVEGRFGFSLVLYSKLWGCIAVVSWVLSECVSCSEGRIVRVDVWVSGLLLAFWSSIVIPTHLHHLLCNCFKCLPLLFNRHHLHKAPRVRVRLRRRRQELLPHPQVGPFPFSQNSINASDIFVFSLKTDFYSK